MVLLLLVSLMSYLLLLKPLYKIVELSLKVIKPLVNQFYYSKFCNSSFPLSIKEIFKPFIQIYMKIVKNQAMPKALPAKLQKAIDRLVKAQNPDQYYVILYIDWYYFCR